jgi:hypothetical protein
MEKLKNIFNKKKSEKSNNSENIIKYNQSEIGGFLVYSENEPIKAKSKKGLNNIINPEELKDADGYKKIWEKIEEYEENKEAKELLEELWKNISKLINNNIIDCTRK